MKKLLLSAIALAALAYAVPASANVTILDKLSGTGDNVVFNLNTLNLVQGSFNGQHQGLVDFSCLGGCTNFVGAQSGNDLKITADGLTNLSVQVFDSAHANVLPTQTDVFSITGTGHVFVGVTANEPGGGTQLITFDLFTLFGALGPGQNGFTLTAIDGETISKFTLLDVGGTITDFEHYRIDVAVPSAVPEPATWGMMLLGFVGLGFAFRQRRRMVGFAA
jgi:PEP-CTERM motif